VKAQISRRSVGITTALPRREDGVTFLNIQIFSLIYLQKFAIGPISFQLDVPMMILFISMIWMVMSNRLHIRLERLAGFLLFFGMCLMSQVISGTDGSIPSILYLAVLYSFFLVTVELTQAGYLSVLDRFVKFMIIPAIIMIVQFSFQKATGQPDPIDMNHLLPPSILQQGYCYDLHYPWYVPFSRPNGFFLLEPSFASAFAAAAAIIEITYFRRLRYILLMLVGTFLSLGATGTSLLIVAAPFLLAREKPGVIAAVVVAVIVALLTAYMFNLPLPLVSRTDELSSSNSSGTDRLLDPAKDFISLLSNPAFLFSGTGAGSSSVLLGATSTWPMVKILQEYGLVTMTSFVMFYLCCIVGNFNVPLKISLSVIYGFTGGYLLSPAMVELLALTCFMVVPLRTKTMRVATGPEFRLRSAGAS